MSDPHPHPHLRAIGQAFQEHRVATGMTQSDVIENAGVGSTPALSRFEAGRGDISLMTFEAWATATGTTTARLYTRARETMLRRVEIERAAREQS